MAPDREGGDDREAISCSSALEANSCRVGWKDLWGLLFGKFQLTFRLASMGITLRENICSLVEMVAEAFIKNVFAPPT
jgi:hypothetical protein